MALQSPSPPSPRPSPQPLNSTDLSIVVYENGLDNLIRRLKREDILDCLKEWDAYPEIRPRSNYDPKVLEHYPKERLIEHVKLDYPDGLTKFQAARISLKVTEAYSQSRAWSFWELQEKESTQLQTYLSRDTIRKRIAENLAGWYPHAYVLTASHREMDACWITVTVFESQAPNEFPRNGSVHFLFFPDTPYLLQNGRVTGGKPYIEHAIATSFDAASVQTSALSTNKLKDIIPIIKEKNFSGSFKEFKIHDAEENPLDFEQPNKRAKLTNYVQTRDQTRRIVPVDRDLIEQRAAMERDLFHGSLTKGLKKIEIECHIPIRVNESNMQEPDDPFDVKILMRGESIMEGLKAMANRGILDPPVPDYLVDLTSLGLKKVYINEQGEIMQELNEDDATQNALE